MPGIGHFIGGQQVKGASGRYGDVFNPNTGELQASVDLHASLGQSNATLMSYSVYGRYVYVHSLGRTVSFPANYEELASAACHRPWFCFDELTSFADSPADVERFLSTLVANSFVFPASELAAQPNFCLKELDPCASPMQQPASLAPRSNEGERESAAWALARAVAGGGP
jgi:hypothetical protein